MNPEVQALLAVQQDDEGIRAIEARRDALAPRMAALDKARQRATDEVGRNDAALERELARIHALESRIADHRDRHEKNLNVLNQAHKLKEATAAMAQVETARRVLADEESELLGMSRRITDLRSAATASREVLESIVHEQNDARETILIERQSIEAELVEAQAKRAITAAVVGRSLFSKYDRLQQRRRSAAIYALHADFSCGSCDTAIPLQRRPAMASGQSIEICEGCGVLLYLAATPKAE